MTEIFTKMIENNLTPNTFYVLYCIKEKGVNGSDIYVTGSHLVFDKSKNKFVKVSEYSEAIKTKNKPEWFSCLITSDNKIKIGSELFWDWEDHFIKTI